MKIYLVATIKNIQSKIEAKLNGMFGIAYIGETRTVGYFTTLEEAKKCIEENWGDIQEHYYKYAVIEEVEDGLYKSINSESIWYKWSNTQDRYIQIDKPAQLSNEFGFTIG